MVEQIFFRCRSGNSSSSSSHFCSSVAMSPPSVVSSHNRTANNRLSLVFSEKKACRELRQFLPTVLDIWWILRSGLVEISMIERQEQCSFSVSEDLQENVHTSFRTSQSEKWILVMQDVLWVASIAFIVYMGDWNSNLIHVLWKDERIKRTELYLGLLCALLNVVVILFITTPFSRDFRRADEESEILIASSAPTIIILGLLSFFWLSVASWPIWSFFTLPLLALDPY